jgi:uroporphyrinogen-III synthase
VVSVLRGFTVGITADRRWDEQAALFERRGATVLHGPAIRTLPLGSDAPLRDATEALIRRPPAGLVANTGLGIRSWLSAAETWGLGEQLVGALRRARIYARGPKASGAVHSAGLHVTAKAPSERLAEAVDLALADLPAGSFVAVQIDGSGDTPEIERMRAAGADVLPVPVYEWKLPDDPRPALRLAEGVVAGRVHAVTFTAGPAVRNWLAIAAEHELDGPLLAALNGGGNGHVVVGCVGPVCAEAAVREGIGGEHLVVPAAFRLGPLVRAVSDRLVSRARRLRLDGHDVTLSGTHLRIDEQDQVLTDIEARLLAMLADRPNVVLAKRELAAQVWRDAETDPHAVEVAVARLRRRLGPLASTLASVHRRGYVLRP